jgi:hypothetical protein
MICPGLFAEVRRVPIPRLGEQPSPFELFPGDGAVVFAVARDADDRFTASCVPREVEDASLPRAERLDDREAVDDEAPHGWLWAGGRDAEVSCIPRVVLVLGPGRGGVEARRVDDVADQPTG